MFDERKWKILRAIIDDYISTAEPIGSRTITRKHSFGVSPATIRNEMADLEDLGFLEQPHTSAGRIPSAKGYRFYVDCLMSPPKITEHDVAMIDNWYRTKTHNMDEVFQETAKILARFTKNMALVMTPQLMHCRFRYLQFLPFDKHNAILVIVTDNGVVENKVIELPSDIAFEDLHSIANAINQRLSGRTVDMIKPTELQDIRRDAIPKQEIIDRALQIVRQALVSNTSDKIYRGGTTQLLQQPEFRDSARMHQLLSVLEENKLVVDILNKDDEAGDNDSLIVTIGHENKFSGIHDCSVVQATYRLNGQVVGKVAVLGPTRMEYSRIVSLLNFMQAHLDEVSKRF